MVTVQVAPLTDVQPNQLLKDEPGAGSATSVTVAPFATEVEQPVVAPVVQLRPGPLTVPPAPYVPEEETLRAYSLGWNVAVAIFGPVMLIVQVAPLTLVQPVQLLKMEPGAGSATSVTVEPFAAEVEQLAVEPVVQLRPGPFTVPLAPYIPEADTVRGYSFSWNEADTVFAAVMVTVQVAPLTVVQPDQLFKNEPGAGSATSVTVAPFATEVEQPDVEPVVQLRPGPLTVPLAP
jgi:hypothetical protein